MQFWEMATSVTEEKLTPTVFLSLSGKAREVTLEMDPDKYCVKGGLKLLYAKLNKLFEMDSNQAALKACGDFKK